MTKQKPLLLPSVPNAPAYMKRCGSASEVLPLAYFALERLIKVLVGTNAGAALAQNASERRFPNLDAA